MKKVFRLIIGLFPRRPTLYVLTQRAGLAKVEKELYQERLANKAAEEESEKRSELEKLTELLQYLHPICSELEKNGSHVGHYGFPYYENGKVRSTSFGNYTGSNRYCLVSKTYPREDLQACLQPTNSCWPAPIFLHIYLCPEGLFVHEPKLGRYRKAWNPAEPESLSLSEDDVKLLIHKDVRKMINRDLRKVTRLLKAA